MKTRLGHLYLIALCWSAIPNNSLADSAQTIDELKRCAKITEQDNRIDCYEALGQRVLLEDKPGEAPAVAKPAVAVSTGTAAVVTPSNKEKSVDTMGGYKFDEKTSDSSESNDDTYDTRVIQCQKDSGGSWYFKFENGQVWKQVDRRILNFQGCDFAVTVIDGGFGYSMKVDGRKGNIRISRRK